MHRFNFASLAGLLLLAACNNAKASNDANFTKAINEYLTKHGEEYTIIGRQFPLDLPRLEQHEQYGIGPKLTALEQAGLLHASDTTAVARGMLDPLRGSGPAQPVRRYELAESRKRDFQQISGVFGQTSGFCYGQKTVDTIVK